MTIVHNPGMEALLLEKPEGDTERLVYCDWLDDNGGDPKVIEFLRHNKGARQAVITWRENWFEEDACKVPLVQVLSMLIQIIDFANEFKKKRDGRALLVKPDGSLLSNQLRPYTGENLSVTVTYFPKSEIRSVEKNADGVLIPSRKSAFKVIREQLSEARKVAHQVQPDGNDDSGTERGG